MHRPTRHFPPTLLRKHWLSRHRGTSSRPQPREEGQVEREAQVYRADRPRHKFGVCCRLDCFHGRKTTRTTLTPQHNSTSPRKRLFCSDQFQKIDVPSPHEPQTWRLSAYSMHVCLIYPNTIKTNQPAPTQTQKSTKIVSSNLKNRFLKLVWVHTEKQIIERKFANSFYRVIGRDSGR